jgi:hypothetical protein
MKRALKSKIKKKNSNRYQGYTTMSMPTVDTAPKPHGRELVPVMPLILTLITRNVCRPSAASTRCASRHKNSRLGSL